MVREVGVGWCMCGGGVIMVVVGGAWVIMGAVGRPKLTDS